MRVSADIALRFGQGRQRYAPLRNAGVTSPAARKADLVPAQCSRVDRYHHKDFPMLGAQR